MSIEFQGRIIETPNGWNDLELEQALKAYALMIDDNLGEYSRRYILLQDVIGISLDELNELRRLCVVENGGIEGNYDFDVIVEALFACTDFLFTEGAINPTLTRCPYPHLTDSDGLTLYGPADGFENISFQELATLFELYAVHVRADTDEVADKMANQILATIYRPTKEATAENKAMNYEGDVRQVLLRHEAAIEGRVVYFTYFPPLVKSLLLFWVGCCLHHIATEHGALFDPSVGTARGKDFGWTGVMLKLANGVVHLNEVAVQPYGQVLTYLEMLDEERKSVEKEEK